jgi:serine/threonine-protein kinase
MTNASKPPERPSPVAPTLSASTIDLPSREGTHPPGGRQADPYIGQTIDGRYVIDRLLGEGGMGVVYAGRHKVIDKRVAIKVLRRDMANDDELNERFLQEARAASAIGNPHIVDISDFGQLPDGSTYFVMELLEGKSLSQVIAEAPGPMPLARLCHLAKQMAQGLAAAHAANIVHRDLKPDNVMIVARGTEPDFVKVLDFGIAKVGSGTKKVTRAGSVFGTPHYMSPEQAAGAVVDQRTDIYALGVIVYEMASGKVPFDADNFMGILTQHMYKAPVPIRALVPEVDVSPGLDAIVLKCLTKKPDGRYASMGELLADLERLERGTLPNAVHDMMVRSGGFNVPADYFRSSAAMPAPVPAEPATVRSRWPLVATIGAVATVVGVMGVIVVARTTSSRAEAPPAQGVVLPLARPAPEKRAEVTPLPAAPEATTREVLVSVVPGDAVIARGGTELGQSPVALHLRDTETATLTIARKGYKPKTVIVSAMEPKPAFTLEPISSPAPPRPAVLARPASPNPLTGIDDVGDPFAKKP